MKLSKNILYGIRCVMKRINRTNRSPKASAMSCHVSEFRSLLLKKAGSKKLLLVQNCRTRVLAVRFGKSFFELKEWKFWTQQNAVSTKLGREMISITCIMRNDPSPLVSKVSLMYSCRDLPAKTKRDLIQRKKRWRVHQKYYKNKIKPLLEYFKQKCASFVFWAGTAGRETACEDRLWAGSIVSFVIVWGKFRRCAREWRNHEEKSFSLRAGGSAAKLFAVLTEVSLVAG